MSGVVLNTPSSLPSPSLDPALMDAPEVTHPLVVGHDTSGAPILHPAHGAAKTALDAMHRTTVALLAAESSLRGNADPAATKRLRAAAERQFAELGKAATDAISAIDSHRERVNTEIEAALGIPEARESVTAAMRASDIRAHVRTLPNPLARMEALRAAISAGDREAGAAAISCSPLALGIGQREADTLRDFAEHHFARPLVTVREGLTRLRGIMERASAAASERFGAVVGKGGDSPEAKREAALRALEEVK